MDIEPIKCKVCNNPISGFIYTSMDREGPDRHKTKFACKSCLDKGLAKWTPMS